jgi:NAD(P)-dependent dehydrogenase (short-subunit alcohol dehydrogenase family)
MAGTEGSKVVLITGASGGVGRGMALACGEAGWEVWIAARRAAQGEAVAAEVDAAGGTGRFVACDVADEGSVVAVLAEIESASGRLDGIVHNSTSGLSSRSGPLSATTLEDLEDHVRVALRGLHLLGRHGLGLLQASGGSMVVMTSEAGFEGKKLLGPYAMVKAAQRGTVRALAREWGPLGVRVNAIAPLAGTEAMERAFLSDPSMEERVMSRNPLRRLGDPADDIGPVARFLLSDDARYVTGQTIMVDGGSCPIT